MQCCLFQIDYIRHCCRDLFFSWIIFYWKCSAVVWFCNVYGSIWCSSFARRLASPTQQKVFGKSLWDYEMNMNRLNMTWFSLRFSNMQLWAGTRHLLTEHCCCTSLAVCHFTRPIYFSRWSHFMCLTRILRIWISIPQWSLHTTDLLLGMISLHVFNQNPQNLNFNSTMATSHDRFTSRDDLTSCV